jgi:hypothetical protein
VPPGDLLDLVGEVLPTPLPQGRGIYTVWFVWLAALGVLLATRRVAPGSRSI